MITSARQTDSSSLADTSNSQNSGLISENWTKDEQLRILFESWGPGGEIQRDNQNKNPCIFVLFESCPYRSSLQVCLCTTTISGEHTSLCINASFAEKGGFESPNSNLILIKCGRFGLPLFCFGNFGRAEFDNECFKISVPQECIRIKCFTHFTLSSLILECWSLGGKV